MERGLHPIPSVIDLPTQLQMEMDDENVSASTGRSGRGSVTPSDVKKRKNGSNHEFGQDDRTFQEKANGHVRQASDGAKASEAEVRHYDADGTFVTLPSQPSFVVVAKPS